MGVVITVAILAVSLFVASYITKRRFGLLGLALASGYLLSNIWGYNAGLVAGIFGVPYNPLTSAIILVAITMLPPIVLLFHGYTYKSFIGRVVGAVLFTILALAFLVVPLGHILNLQGFGVDVYNWMLKNKDTIIGLGLPLAVADLFFTRPAGLNDKKSKH
jgi:hypothetical protein